MGKSPVQARVEGANQKPLNWMVTMPNPPNMKPNTVLILPFSELGTKSRKTRDKMMLQLLTNVKHVFKNVFSVEYTKIRQKQTGSLRNRPRLYGYELWLRTSR